MRKKLTKIVGPMLLVLLSGCTASFGSHKSDGTFESGLAYYLPEKDVVITVVVDDELKHSVSIGETEHFADLSERYILNFKANLLGKNTMKLGVNSSGLLTNADSTTASAVATALGSIAEIRAESTASAFHADSGARPCDHPGTYVFLYRLKSMGVRPGGPACGVTVSAEPISGALSNSWTPGSDFVDTNQAGIYYRQNIPYLVQARWTNQNSRFLTTRLVLSPSGSDVKFLPIKKTLFAGNIATLKLVNGIPEKYEQDADSEVAAFLALPATVIGAYFSAVGEIFKRDTKVLTDETALIGAEIALAKKQRQFDLCKAAITSKDDTAISEKCK